MNHELLCFNGTIPEIREIQLSQTVKQMDTVDSQK